MKNSGIIVVSQPLIPVALMIGIILSLFYSKEELMVFFMERVVVFFWIVALLTILFFYARFKIEMAKALRNKENLEEHEENP